MLDPVDYFFERTEALDRAKALYLRGNALLDSAWEKKFKGFNEARTTDGTLAGFLNRTKKSDVPLLYWTVASGLAAYSIDVFDFELGASIPKWAMMIARAYELNPNFQNGALDEFYILFHSSVPSHMGGDRSRVDYHFNRALELTAGLSATPYVAYAQVISRRTPLEEADYEEFKAMLEKALAIDVNVDPSLRLINILAQRRARNMLDHAYRDFSFLPSGGWDF
jgi:hypothetical protein